MNNDIDYCGIIILIRQLVKSSVLTENEARRVALRIKAGLAAGIILSL